MSEESSKLDAPAVSADIYDEDYYLTKCAGFESFNNPTDDTAHGIYQTAIEWSGLQPGMVICDVGAGRGELIAQAAGFGAHLAIGIEYSRAAAGIANAMLRDRSLDDRTRVVLADARRLPIPDQSVDRVYMLDIIEHLAPKELDLALAEAHRVLKPGGQLFAHTFPTRTIYEVTYRAMRTVARIGGARWPAEPRLDLEREMHINEQTRRGLSRSLRRAGFASPNVRFGEWVYVDFLESEAAKRWYHRLAARRITAPLALANLWINAER
jgi:ubiquinone/menaquinone biosynthesis C-methylase UbiE